MVIDGGRRMKLRTIKELINGKYKNIDLDKTYTGKAMNIINATYIFTYIAYLISIVSDVRTEFVLKQATIGAGICMLLVIITGIFGLYFALCETYIGEDY